MGIITEICIMANVYKEVCTIKALSPEIDYRPKSLPIASARRFSASPRPILLRIYRLNFIVLSGTYSFLSDLIITTPIVTAFATFSTCLVSPTSLFGSLSLNLAPLQITAHGTRSRGSYPNSLFIHQHLHLATFLRLRRMHHGGLSHAT